MAPDSQVAPICPALVLELLFQTGEGVDMSCSVGPRRIRPLLSVLFHKHVRPHVKSRLTFPSSRTHTGEIHVESVQMGQTLSELQHFLLCITLLATLAEIGYIVIRVPARRVLSDTLNIGWSACSEYASKIS